MIALSDVIDFLLDLMRDPGARAAFEQNPDAALADAGLDGLTAQDVRDAQLVLADDGRASADGAGSPPGGDDPVREIHYTTNNYTAAAEQPDPVDQSASIVTIDDRDTFVFQNSFNSDDDGIDTGGGDLGIDNSVTETDVVAIDAENSFNSDDDVDTDVVAINESFNDITDNDTDVDVTDIDVTQVEDSFNGGAPETAEEAVAEEPEPDPAPEDLAPEDPESEDTAADLDPASDVAVA